jgi:hypothetical protein
MSSPQTKNIHPIVRFFIFFCYIFEFQLCKGIKKPTTVKRKSCYFTVASLHVVTQISSKDKTFLWYSDYYFKRRNRITFARNGNTTKQLFFSPEGHILFTKNLYFSGSTCNQDVKTCERVTRLLLSTGGDENRKEKVPLIHNHHRIKIFFSFFF